MYLIDQKGMGVDPPQMLSRQMVPPSMRESSAGMPVAAGEAMSSLPQCISMDSDRSDIYQSPTLSSAENSDDQEDDLYEGLHTDFVPAKHQGNEEDSDEIGMEGATPLISGEVLLDQRTGMIGTVTAADDEEVMGNGEDSDEMIEMERATSLSSEEVALDQIQIAGYVFDFVSNSDSDDEEVPGKKEDTDQMARIGTFGKMVYHYIPDIYQSPTLSSAENSDDQEDDLYEGLHTDFVPAKHQIATFGKKVFDSTPDESKARPDLPRRKVDISSPGYPISTRCTAVVDFLLHLCQVKSQFIAGRLRFLVSLIMLLVLPSLDLTADDGMLDIKCHPKANDVVIQDCLSLYSAETRPFISSHFLVWITASLLIVLWSAIIFYNAKELPKIKRTIVYSEKEALCCEFWKKFFLHVCCEAVVVAVSLAYLCYTQKMYLTENTFDCHLKNDVTCNIEPHWDIENPIIIIIGGMSTILVFCMLTICDAICNKEAFIKDLVNSSTGRATRKMWTHAENVKVMECYYKSRRSRGRGYMQRMLNLWIEEGMFLLSKERLASQARSILKRKLLSEDELKEIKERVGFHEQEGRQGRQVRCVIC